MNAILSIHDIARLGPHRPRRGGIRLSLNSFFGEDGGSSPWYPNATQHNALYDAVADKTFIAYEGYLPNSGRRFTYVRAYDHATGVMGRPYVVGPESAITNDDHGVPSLNMNADGRLVVVWGNHDGAFHCAISTNPHDNTSWINGPDLGGSYTYPHQILMADGRMAVTFRNNIVPGTTFPNGAKVFVYVPLTFAGTTITAGTEVSIGDLGDDSRWYAGKQYDLGNGRHAQVCTRANYGDTYRRNMYYYEIDLANSKFVSLDGTEVAFPITEAAMDATFKIYDTSTDNTSNIPGFALDADGRRHLIFNDGGSTDAGGANEAPQTMYHMVSEGTGWGLATEIGTGTQRYNSGAIVPLEDGSVDVYWSADLHGGTTQRGGAILTRHLPAGGSSADFEPQKTLLDQDLVNGRPLDGTTNVLNAASALRLLFCERQSTPDDGPDTGNLKLYGYGDNGLVAVPRPALVMPQPLTGDGFWIDLSDTSRLLNDASAAPAIGDRIGQVTDRFNGYVFTTAKGPDLRQIAGRNALSFGGAFSASQYLEGPVKAWGNGGFLATAIIRHWAPNSTSIHLMSCDGGSGSTRIYVIKTLGNQIGATVFHTTTGTDLLGGAGNQKMGQDYIIQLYTIGTNAYLEINGALIVGPTPINGGAVTTGTNVMRIGCSGNPTKSSYWLGSVFGIIARQGEQTSDMRATDYQWALSQMPR